MIASARWRADNLTHRVISTQVGEISTAIIRKDYGFKEGPLAGQALRCRLELVKIVPQVPNWEIKTTLKWSERFEQLKTFKQKHNHCLVPRNYDEENMEGLGKWVAQQRHAYRLLKDGKPTTMTSERVQQFNDLGMVWSILTR